MPHLKNRLSRAKSNNYKEYFFFNFVKKIKNIEKYKDYNY